MPSTGPFAARCVAAAAATWPPLAVHQAGPFLVGEGAGGGQRVSTARLCEGAGPQDWPAAIAAAEGCMTALGQKPAFQVLNDPKQRALDRALAANGYVLGDHVLLLAREIVARPPPDPAITLHWPPSAAQMALWETCGIGPARIAVMARAAAPLAALALARDDEVLATAFVAIHDGIAVTHAVDVAPSARRQGLGRRLMAGVMDWAVGQGAGHLALLVVAENRPARALYDSMGFAPVAEMHYRVKEGA